MKIQKGTVLGLFEPVDEIEVSNVSNSDQEFVSHISKVGAEILPCHLKEMYENGRENLSIHQTEQFKQFSICQTR